MKILNKTIFVIMCAVLAATFSVRSVLAHSLWINSFESFSHKPGHTTISLGWGHALPVDDILNSPNGKVIIKEFSITDPKGEKTDLKIPSNEIAEPDKQLSSFDIYTADVALQKIALKKDSPEGVYKIEAKSKPTFYTQYIDNKNRKRFKLNSIDKLKNVKEVVFALKYQAFATSYLTTGKWTEPQATGDGLEIIPKTDLSNLKVGDLVEFEIFFYGKPLSSGAKGIEYITASSPSFGQSHNFSLFSKIKHGKAQFVVQSSGQWMVSCGHKEIVKKDGKLKDLYGKANNIAHASTLTFNVK